MTVGYIGNGKSANRYHIPFVLQRQDKIKIKMIYTLDHSRDIWDEIPGVFYTENLDELLNDKDIQVIVISTPSAFHYDYAKMVLHAGNHCVVEKPFFNRWIYIHFALRSISEILNRQISLARKP